MCAFISSLLRKTLGSSILRPRTYCSSFISPFSSATRTKIPQTPSEPSEQPSSLYPFDGITAYTKRKKADLRLSHLICDEIDEISESVDTDEEVDVPEKFPFQIIDGDADKLILKRYFNGERVHVEARYLGFAEEEEEEEEEEAESSSSLNLSLVVKLTRRSGISLVFYCTARSTQITVEKMQLERSVADGPIPTSVRIFNISDFGEKFQKALYNLLESRGIDGSLVNFLQSYMILKDGKESVALLRGLSTFLVDF
ncbi:uncharacterized protein At2g39795, mitochondrial-like [Tasmannia lanceolata]|uniref:uncharacterized protein At2g39795, mitochondrial-like n=1 Tax=Tasmannia lanceolata TaxID=3420 RepID=UPI0040627D7D